MLLMALVFQMQDTFLRVASSFQHVQFPHKMFCRQEKTHRQKVCLGAYTRSSDQCSPGPVQLLGVSMACISALQGPDWQLLRKKEE